MRHKSRHYYTLSSIIILVIVLIAASISHAEFLGSPSGQTTEFAALPKIGLEASFSSSDFSNVDYQGIGLRLSYRYSSQALLFGDAGKQS